MINDWQHAIRQLTDECRAESASSNVSTLSKHKQHKGTSYSLPYKKYHKQSAMQHCWLRWKCRIHTTFFKTLWYIKCLKSLHVFFFIYSNARYVNSRIGGYTVLLVDWSDNRIKFSLSLHCTNSKIALGWMWKRNIYLQWRLRGLSCFFRGIFAFSFFFTTIPFLPCVDNLKSHATLAAKSDIIMAITSFNLKVCTTRQKNVYKNKLLLTIYKQLFNHTLKL